MLRLLLTIVLVSCVGCLPLQVQAQAVSKKISDLEKKRADLQEEIKKSETVLITMRKNVKSQMSDLAVLDNQLEKQELLVKTIEADVQALEKEINFVESQLDTLETDIRDKKNRYERAMQHAYLNNREVKDKLMFVFSASTVSQMYRRARYIKEYSVYLKAQAEQIQIRQQQIQKKRADLLVVKGEKSKLLRQREEEKTKLQGQQGTRRKLLKELQRKQWQVQQEVNKKKKQQQTLNAQIDKLVAQEIAAAKKREEEKRKKEAAAAKKAQSKATASNSTTNKNTTSSSSTSSSASAKTERMGTYEVGSADRKLAGTFESNKGQLPMPITGGYSIVGHYGTQNVGGLKNVRVDNKGIDIKGQAGASARAVFDGEVSAVFSYSGVKGVLVRHGNYISVYVNLSSVSVSQGQRVKARDVLGKVANSKDDGYVLHFQLRKETAKLNPELWLKK